MERTKIQSEDFNDYPRVEYSQPISSPYENPIVTIKIGSKTYGIPRYFVQKSPLLDELATYDTSITLNNVDEDIGHTFMHFLYTGSYETIYPGLGSSAALVEREFRRSVLVYKAAREYNLPGLEEHAMKYIEHFERSLTIFCILSIVREVFFHLPVDETWLPLHVNEKLREAFVADRSIFTGDEFYNVLGEDRGFYRAIMKMVCGIFSSRLEVLERVPEVHPEPIENHWTAINGQLETMTTQENDSMGVEDSTEAITPEPPVAESTNTGLYPLPTPPNEETPPKDSLPEPPAQENPTIEYIPTQPPPPEPPIEASTPSQPPAETPAANDAPPKSSIPDTSLYDNWKSLPTKKRLKRKKVLKKMGLPVPDSKGVFPTTVG